MIETQARVLSTEQDFAWVEPRPHSPCGQCDPVTGCRSLSIARAFSHGEARFRVHNPLGSQTGDWVSVSVPEQGVLKRALLMYLAPLAGLFAGAALGALASELVSVLVGGFGFAVTLLAVCRFARRYRHSALFQPAITARYSSEPFTMEKTCRSRN